MSCYYCYLIKKNKNWGFIMERTNLTDFLLALQSSCLRLSACNLLMLFMTYWGRVRPIFVDMVKPEKGVKMRL